MIFIWPREEHFPELCKRERNEGRKEMINLKKTAAVLAVLTLLGGCSRAKTEISATPLTQPLASPVSTETPVSASQAESEKGTITLEDAKARALEHAGVKAEDVTFLKTGMDYENNTQVYDIEFISGNTEYDYEINAATGEIVSFDRDAETPGSTATAAEPISEEQALNTALAKAGVNRSDITRLKTKLDMEDGRQVYEIEFRSGNLEYEFEIDASTGEIRKYETDKD